MDRWIIGGGRRYLQIGWLGGRVRVLGAVPEVGPEAFEAAGIDDGVVGVDEEGTGAESDDVPGV